MTVTGKYSAGMPADVVSSFIAAIERNDLDHALSHLTDDCEYHNIPLDPVVGREAVRAVLAALPGHVRRGAVAGARTRSSRAPSTTASCSTSVSTASAADDRWLDLPVAGVFVVRHGQIAAVARLLRPRRHARLARPAG